jgi:hypothetical protein
MLELRTFMDGMENYTARYLFTRSPDVARIQLCFASQCKQNSIDLQ